MNYFYLKLLAAVCMVIDHIGAAIYPDESLLRIIGRVSFPVFAYLLIQGERHTKNIRAYMTRLVIFAIISQPVYVLLFETSQLNVLVTLSLGLCVIRLSKNFPSQRYFIWAIGILIAGSVSMDAGAYGLCAILLMSEWRSPTTFSRTICWWFLWIMLHLVDQWMGASYLQLWATPVPLLFYGLNHQRGPRARWFYGFYPGHLATLLIFKGVLAS